MAVTTNSALENKKGKRPPTFQHLPINRAKKLKKEWVEKAKVRSQWTAQKRKEGISTRVRDAPPHRRDTRNGGEFEMEGEREGLDRHQNRLTGQSASDAELPQESRKRIRFADQPKPGPSESYNAPKRRQENRNDFSAVRSKKPITVSNPNRREPPSTNLSKAETDTEEASLRDLTRAAYARSELHTFKSDPLRRNKQNTGKSKGSRNGQKGAGQPNMKLRMEAMLERIKKEHGPGAS